LAEETAAAVLARLGRPVVANSRERPIPRLAWDEQLPSRSLPPQMNAACVFSGDVIRQVIRDEWVQRLEDLVERRLLLHFHPGLSRQVLQDLAACLVHEGQLAPAEVGPAVQCFVLRLAAHFGRQIE
jgi:hypothetical protein